MSTATSLFAPQIPICKSQEFPKDTRSTNRENPCPKSTLDTKFNRRNLLRTVGLSLIGDTCSGALVHHAAKAEPESPDAVTSNRISYSRFLEYLNEGAVKKVDLFENGMVAIVEILNPALDKIQRVKVQLPGLQQELVRKLREKKVDFAAHPIPMQMNIAAAALDVLANFGFPLILLGALLLRSSSPNTPGGPNLPFGLGRYAQQIWNVRDRAVVVD